MKRTPLKRKTRLKPMSAKRKAESVIYRASVREWIEDRIRRDDYLRCQFKFDAGRCIMPAMTSPHHRKGRGKYLTVKRYFMALCLQHHYWCHFVDPKEARKRKYILY